MTHSVYGRKPGMLALAVAAALSVSGCNSDDGGGGGANACVGGATAFFADYAGTYNLEAAFRGIGSDNDADPVTLGVFTDGNTYDITLAADQTITFESDGADFVFDYTDAANNVAICERGVIDGDEYEVYVRIDTDEYSVLFQVVEGEDGELGTEDDEYNANLIILNDESGSIISNFVDDEFWNFQLPAPT